TSLARSGQSAAGARTVGPGARVVHGGLRHARSERGEGVAQRVGVIKARHRCRPWHFRTAEISDLSPQNELRRTLIQVACEYTPYSVNHHRSGEKNPAACSMTAPSANNVSS